MSHCALYRFDYRGAQGGRLPTIKPSLGAENGRQGGATHDLKTAE